MPNIDTGLGEGRRRYRQAHPGRDTAGGPVAEDLQGLAATALGRGRLAYRAERGDQEARQVLEREPVAANRGPAEGSDATDGTTGRQDELEEALGLAALTETQLWKERAARRHGLDDDLMAMLTGESAEEIEERAATLAGRLAAAANTQRRPAPDPSQGQGSAVPGSGVALGRRRYRHEPHRRDWNNWS
jgi:hypothetical protein